jgi:hypothetical protein
VLVPPVMAAAAVASTAVGNNDAAAPLAVVAFVGVTVTHNSSLCFRQQATLQYMSRHLGHL